MSIKLLPEEEVEAAVKDCCETNHIEMKGEDQICMAAFLTGWLNAYLKKYR